MISNSEAAALKLKDQAKARDAEASRISKLDSAISIAAYAAEISRSDLSADAKLKAKARAFKQLGKALVARGLAQFADELPELPATTDKELRLQAKFVKGFARLICASGVKASAIISHLELMREFPATLQTILCQRIWNIPHKLLMIEQNHNLTMLAETADDTAAPGRGRCWKRNLTWLNWYEAKETDPYHSPAKIRDRWNRENKDEKIDESSGGRDVVEKGIEKAREYRDSSRGKSKPR